MDERVEQRIEEILSAIENYISGNPLEMGLFSGNCGISLFLFCYARTYNDERIFDKGLELMNVTIDNIDNDQFNSFSSGLPGLAYTISLLNKSKILETDIDSEVDEYLVNLLKAKLRIGESYDYLHGILGIALYFIEKENLSKKDVELLTDVVEFIEQKSIIHNNSKGCKWQCNFNTLSSPVNIDDFDLSLAHGSAGIILILCKLYQKEIEKKRVAQLISKSIDYLLEQEFDLSLSYSYFPSSVRDNVVKPSRLAWCYGDLGIAWALWNAGSLLGNKFWSDKAIRIFNHSVNRKTFEETSIIDAGFCHGASGVSHFFQRMYQETELPLYKEASTYWLEKTLELNNYPDGPAGYKSCYMGEWYGSYTLLEGISGIGLALLSFGSEEHFWDRPLLMS